MPNGNRVPVSLVPEDCAQPKIVSFGPYVNDAGSWLMDVISGLPYNS